MFKKFKQQASEVYQSGKDKVKEVKKDYKDKQQSGWLKEVTLENKNFAKAQIWFNHYEPSNKNSSKGESKSQQMLQEKMNQVLVNTMTDNVMSTIMESLALATEAAAEELNGIEPLIYDLINGITSIFLTYRFEYKNKKKFQFLRGACVDRICVVFTQIVDIEAKNMGKDPNELDDQALQKIVDKVCTKIANLIEKKKEVTLQKFKNSTLFNITGLNNNDEIDEIIKMVMDIVQTFGEAKLNEVVGEVRTQLPKIFKEIVLHQRDIRENIIHQQKYGENSSEYDKGAKNDILNKIDGQYNTLRNFIKMFISRFSGLVISNAGQEEQAEEEKTNN